MGELWIIVEELFLGYLLEGWVEKLLERELADIYGSWEGVVRVLWGVVGLGDRLKMIETIHMGKMEKLK